jgi:DnaJ-class molecular chaperone
MAKNYYAVLGVSRRATPEEIRAAYRRLARVYHPDLYGPDSGPFLDVQEAYGVVGDPARRRRYDRSLERVRHTPERPRAPVADGTRRSPVEPLDSLGPVADLRPVSLFDSSSGLSRSFSGLFDRLWRSFGGLDDPTPVLPDAPSLAIRITPEEASRGGQVRVSVPARATCPTCRGLGGVGPYECWRCAGEGEMRGDVPVTIGFPAGIRDGHEIGVPLARFGFPGVELILRFRVGP